METASSSKLSRSRREEDRGPKRKERRLERARQHKLAKGETWVPPEILRTQSTEAATGSHGSVVEEGQAQKMNEKKAEPLPDEEQKQKLIEEGLMDETVVDMQRWAKEKDRQPYCWVCKKRAICLICNCL